MWIMLPIVIAALATVVATPVLVRKLALGAQMGQTPVLVALVAIPLYAAFFAVCFAFTSRVRQQAPELPEPLYDEPEAKGH
jgi:hypothetical protein